MPTPTNGNDILRYGAAGDAINALAGNDRVNAGGGDDVVHGNAGNDKFFGEAGNDQLWGEAGNDRIDGGAGTDSAHFSGNQSQYQITTSGGVTEVKDLRGQRPDGVDQLTNVERLVFADGAKLLVSDQAPRAGNDTANTDEDTAISIDVRANDSDPDGDTLTIASLADADPNLAGIQTAQGATIGIANGQIHYDPATSARLQALDTGQNLADSFSYTVSDGFGGSASATVGVTVSGVAEPLPPGVVFNPANGHYYQSIATSGTPSDGAARFAIFEADAANRSVEGQQGYLATITSQAEMDFLLGALGGGLRARTIGASVAEQEGTWKWETGPEAGTVFYVFGAATQPGYSNWGSGEPSSQEFFREGEDYANLSPATSDPLGIWRDGAIRESG